jgi:hypothetical protein
MWGCGWREAHRFCKKKVMVLRFDPEVFEDGV